MRRFPGRFSAVCRVDVEGVTVLKGLERWAGEGAESLGLRNFQRSPEEDPLADVICRFVLEPNSNNSYSRVYS